MGRTCWTKHFTTQRQKDAAQRFMDRETAEIDKAFAWYWKDQWVRVGLPQIEGMDKLEKAMRMAFEGGWEERGKKMYRDRQAALEAEQEPGKQAS